jgi:hypothetical protein
MHLLAARRELLGDLAHRPGFAALKSAAFGYPSVERKVDAAARGGPNRVPSLSKPALDV